MFSVQIYSKLYFLLSNNTFLQHSFQQIYSTILMDFDKNNKRIQQTWLLLNCYYDQLQHSLLLH